MKTPIKRRSFIRWMTVGAIASSLPVAIAACTENKSQGPVSSGSPLPVPPNAVPPNVASGSAVGTVADLDKAGFLEVAIDGKPAIVVRDPKNKTELIAVNSMCTHQGCKVGWNAGQSAYVCPCHGATYDATGNVTKGPADKPLKRHTAKIEGVNIVLQV
jgi:cytochrome b6-f complex iron-sulfur subunit